MRNFRILEDKLAIIPSEHFKHLEEIDDLLTKHFTKLYWELIPTKKLHRDTVSGYILQCNRQFSLVYLELISNLEKEPNIPKFSFAAYTNTNDAIFLDEFISDESLEEVVVAGRSFLINLFRENLNILKD